MKKILLVAGAALAFTACTSDKNCGVDSGLEACDSSADSGATDSGPDGCENYTGPTEIGFDSTACAQPDVEAGTPAIGYNCDSESWWYDFYTIGWTGGGELFIFQTRDTPPWDEYHPVPSYAFDEETGHWDNLYVLLEETDDAGAVEDGVSTLYDCNDDRESGLTWHLVVFETDGTTQADCAVWGHDPDGLGTGCADWS